MGMSPGTPPNASTESGGELNCRLPSLSRSHRNPARKMPGLSALVVDPTVRVTGIVIASDPLPSTVTMISPVYVPAANVGLATTLAVMARGVAQQLKPETVTDSQLPPAAVYER